MKRVLIVSNSSGLVTLFLKNDVELLINHGFQVECACNTNFPDSNTKDFFEKYHINVMHVDFPIRNLDVKKIFSSYKTLKRLINMENYSLVHCHSTIAAIIARQCAKEERKNGIKVIYTSHGFPFYEGVSGKKAFVYKVIENYYSRFTDAIITICREDFNNAKKMHCKNVYKINGVGVNFERFSLKEFNRNTYREYLGIKREEKVVLSIGELNTNKNHQVVIRALALINDKKMVYAICGREVTEIGKKEELLKLANYLGVKVLFLGFRKDIPEVCHCADIGAIPSFKEGLGLSGIEMLASGIPVVGSCRQGIKDYIINGETGYLCEPSSPESFADGIKKSFSLIDKQGTKEKCISVSRQYSIENSRDKMKDIYGEILGE